MIVEIRDKNGQRLWEGTNLPAALPQCLRLGRDPWFPGATLHVLDRSAELVVSLASVRWTHHERNVEMDRHWDRPVGR